jgi:hypothetical protein
MLAKYNLLFGIRHHLRPDFYQSSNPPVRTGNHTAGNKAHVSAHLSPLCKPCAEYQTTQLVFEIRKKM